MRAAGIENSQEIFLKRDGPTLEPLKPRFSVDDIFYKVIIQSTQDGFCLADIKGNIIEVNDAFCRMLGYSREQLLTMKICDFDVEFMKAPGKLSRRINELRVAGDRHVIKKHQRKDGRIIDVAISIRYLDIEPGLIFCFHRDITEKKMAHEALRESENNYRSLFQHMLNGYALCKIIVDEENEAVDFQYIDVNRAFERLTGLKKQAVIGEKATSVFPNIKELNPEIISICGKVALTGKPAKFEVFFKPLGKWLAVCVHSPRRSHFVTVFDDVTERKQKMKELKASQQALRELHAHTQSAREQERAIMARELHDEMGQRLTSLKMDLSWLRKKLDSGQGSLIEKTEAMAELVDSTIQVVRQVSSKLRPQILDDLGIVAAVEWYAGKFRKRSAIDVRINSSHEDIILGKERSTAIFRVIQEALTNVVRHACAKRVVISLEKKDGRFNVRITDNGKGITRDEILSPKSYGIMGMRERVHNMGGRFEIKRNWRHGTTISASLPLGEYGP